MSQLIMQGCCVTITNSEKGSGKTMVGSLAKPNQFTSHLLIDVSIISATFKYQGCGLQYAWTTRASQSIGLAMTRYELFT